MLPFIGRLGTIITKILPEKQHTILVGIGGLCGIN